MSIQVCLVSAHNNPLNWLLEVAFISLPIRDLVATVKAFLYQSFVVCCGVSIRSSGKHIRHVVIAPISLTEAHLSEGSLVLVLGDIDTAVCHPVTEGKVSVREHIR